MARVSKKITVLPATHTRTIPAFTPQPQGITALWLVLITPTLEGWPGWVDLDGLLYTEIGFRHRELNPWPVTHPSTNRARRRVTSLIETNVLRLSQPATGEYIREWLKRKRNKIIQISSLRWTFKFLGRWKFPLICPLLFYILFLINVTFYMTFCIALTTCNKFVIKWVGLAVHGRRNFYGSPNGKVLLSVTFVTPPR